MSIDLENFEQALDEAVYPLSSSSRSMSAEGALKFVDHVWYSQESRKARRMDLIGDYAGDEPFVIDGGPFFLGFKESFDFVF